MKKTFERFSLLINNIQRDYHLIKERVNFIQNNEEDKVALGEGLLKSLWSLHNDRYWMEREKSDKVISSLLASEHVQFTTVNRNDEDTQAYIDLFTALRDDVQLTAKLLSVFCSNEFLISRLSFIVFTSVATFSLIDADINFVEGVIWQLFQEALSHKKSLSMIEHPWLPLLLNIFFSRSTSVNRYLNALLNDILSEVILAFDTSNVATSIAKDSVQSDGELAAIVEDSLPNCNLTFLTILFINKLRETLDLFPASYLRLLARLRFHLRASADTTHLVDRVSISFVFDYLINCGLIFPNYSLFFCGLILTPSHRKVLRNIWFAVNKLAQLTLQNTVCQNAMDYLLDQLGPTADDVISDINISNMRSTLDLLFLRADRLLLFRKPSTKTTPHYPEYLQLNNQPKTKSQYEWNSRNSFSSFLKLVLISQTDLGILTDACRVFANWGQPIPERLQKALDHLPERLDGTLVRIRLISSEESNKNATTKCRPPVQNQGQHSDSASTSAFEVLFCQPTGDVQNFLSTLNRKPDRSIRSSPTSPVRSGKHKHPHEQLQPSGSSSASLDAITTNVTAVKRIFAEKLGNRQSPSPSQSRTASTTTLTSAQIVYILPFKLTLAPGSEQSTVLSEEEFLDAKLPKRYNAFRLGDCCTRCCQHLRRSQPQEPSYHRCSCLLDESQLTHSLQSSNCDFHQPVDANLVSTGTAVNLELRDSEHGGDVGFSDNLHSGELMDPASPHDHHHHHHQPRGDSSHCADGDGNGNDDEDQFSNVSLQNVSSSSASASSTASTLSSLPSGFTSLASSAHALGRKLQASGTAVANASATAASGSTGDEARRELEDGQRNASPAIKRNPVVPTEAGAVAGGTASSRQEQVNEEQRVEHSWPINGDQLPRGATNGSDIHELDEHSSAITCSSCGVRFADGHEEDGEEREDERELDDDEDEAGRRPCRHVASDGDISSSGHHQANGLDDEDRLTRGDADLEDGTLSDLPLSSANVSGRVTPLSLASSQSRGQWTDRPQRGGSGRPLAAGFVLPNDSVRGIALALGDDGETNRYAADMGLHNALMQQHRHRQHASPDVTEKFGKFDLPPVRASEHEARSTVSDTWSTDVLASDTEYPELSQDLPELTTTGANGAQSDFARRHHGHHRHSRDNHNNNSTNNHHSANRSHRAHRHNRNRPIEHPPLLAAPSSQPPFLPVLQGASTGSDTREGTPGISSPPDDNLGVDEVVQDASENTDVDAECSAGALPPSSVDDDDSYRRGVQTILPPSPGEVPTGYRQSPQESTPEATSLSGSPGQDHTTADTNTVASSAPTPPSASGLLPRLSENVKEGCSRLKDKFDSMTRRPRFVLSRGRNSPAGEPAISKPCTAVAVDSAVHSQSQTCLQLPSPDTSVPAGDVKPQESCPSNRSTTKSLATAAVSSAATVAMIATLINITETVSSSASSGSSSLSASASVSGGQRRAVPPPLGDSLRQPHRPEEAKADDNCKESVGDMRTGTASNRQPRLPRAHGLGDSVMATEQQQQQHSRQRGDRAGGANSEIPRTPLRLLWKHVLWGFWSILANPTTGQLFADAIWDTVMQVEDAFDASWDNALVVILSGLLVDPLILQIGLTTTIEVTKTMLETLLHQLHHSADKTGTTAPEEAVASSSSSQPVVIVSDDRAAAAGLCSSCACSPAVDCQPQPARGGSAGMPSLPLPNSSRVALDLVHGLSVLRHRRCCAYLLYLEETQNRLFQARERFRVLKDRSEQDIQAARLRRLQVLLVRFLDTQLGVLRRLYDELTELVLMNSADNNRKVGNPGERRHQLVSQVIDELTVKWLANQAGHGRHMGDQSKERVRQTLERLVMEKIYSSGCWTSDAPIVRARDNVFHRELATLQQTVSLVDLHIPEEFHVLHPFHAAQRELRLLNCSHLPSDMTRCLMLLALKIIDSLRLVRPSVNPGADQLLPVLIFVIIQANPPRLLTNLEFMEAFGVESKLKGEEQYIWVQIRAAGAEVRRILSSFNAKPQLDNAA